MKVVGLLLLGLAFTGEAFSDESAQFADFYRNMNLRIRPLVHFKVPMPNGKDLEFSYEMKFSKPFFEKPLTADFKLSLSGDQFYRHFWDKIFVEDGSVLNIGAEQLPLTCVYVNGQDNRNAKKGNPLIPDFILKVYLVANDFSCTGPINPGWPATGGKKETWDTYVYYEIKDPTIMLPMEAKIRYRWNEFPAYLVDGGGK